MLQPPCFPRCPPETSPPCAHRASEVVVGALAGLAAADVLIALLYVGASAGPALFDQNEAQYAGAVREMLNRPRRLPARHAHAPRTRKLVRSPPTTASPRLQKPPRRLLAAHGVDARLRRERIRRARLPNALCVACVVCGQLFLLGRAHRRHRARGATRPRSSPRWPGRFIFCHLIAPRTLPRRDPDADLLVFPRRLSGTGVRGSLDVRGVAVHGAGHRLQGAARRVVPARSSRRCSRGVTRRRGPVWKKNSCNPPGRWYSWRCSCRGTWRSRAALSPVFLRDQFFQRTTRPRPSTAAIPSIATACRSRCSGWNTWRFFLPWTFFHPGGVVAMAVPAARAIPSPSRVPDLGRELVACWFAVTVASHRVFPRCRITT